MLRSARIGRKQIFIENEPRIAHPLNAIIGFSQLLAMEDGLNAQQSDSVVEIHRAGEHLLALINDIIDLSRIETGNIEVSTEAVTVGSVIGHVINLTASLADQKAHDRYHQPLAAQTSLSWPIRCA